MMMRSRLMTIAGGVVVAIAQVAAACPMCKESLPATDAAEAGAVPVGFNYSVYLLLVGMMFCAGMMGVTIVRGIRGADVAKGAGDAEKTGAGGE